METPPIAEWLLKNYIRPVARYALTERKTDAAMDRALPWTGSGEDLLATYSDAQQKEIAMEWATLPAAWEARFHRALNYDVWDGRVPRL